jgi:hypothetical protein
MLSVIKGQIINCCCLADYFNRRPEMLDTFIRYVNRGREMDKLYVMSLLIDQYMGYCHVSLGYRTVVYDMGWAVFNEYVKEGTNDFTGDESFCEVMGKINPAYTSEYDECDVWFLSNEKTIEYAMNLYEETRDDVMISVLSYGLFLLCREIDE